MNDGAEIALLLMMLILPLSALLARRVPIGQLGKAALAWIAIFGVGIIIFAQRDRALTVWETIVPPEQRVAGGTVRIAMARDGHFYADAAINGTRRRMLIDSGATTSGLSASTASAAGITLDGSSFGVMIQTANGTVMAQRARVAELALGDIVARDLPVVVAPEFGDSDVLGMNFLSQLASWRVEGRTLILEPK